MTITDRHSLSQPVLISVGAHLCLLGWLVFGMPRLSFDNGKRVRTIELEIYENPSASHKAHEQVSDSSSDKEASSAVKSAKRFDLGRLGINYRLSPSIGSPQDQNIEGHSVDMVAEGKSSGLYRNIFDRINGNLVYPAELRQRQITGTAYAKFTISKSGEIVHERTRIDSASKYLTVLVAKTLRKAFEQPLAEISRYSDKEVEIVCSFQFDITEHDDADLAQSKQRRVGNQLAFYRYFQHSVLQWQLGPLGGLGPFAGLDVLWFPRKISEALSNKAKIDPLQKYRDDPAW